LNGALLRPPRACVSSRTELISARASSWSSAAVARV
jgi:hypothetical protein